VGLTPQDADFAGHLRNNDYKPQDLNKDSLEKKRKEYIKIEKWKDIHKEFSKEKNGETYQHL
jgi:hypothetical protein